MIDPYERLVHAIVLQAVKDYRSAYKQLKRNPQSDAATRHLISCERFFLSEWFIEITDVDGELLLNKLNEEVGVLDT